MLQDSQSAMTPRPATLLMEIQESSKASASMAMLHLSSWSSKKRISIKKNVKHATTMISRNWKRLSAPIRLKFLVNLFLLIAKIRVIPKAQNLRKNQPLTKTQPLHPPLDLLRVLLTARSPTLQKSPIRSVTRWRLNLYQIMPLKYSTTMKTL